MIGSYGIIAISVICICAVMYLYRHHNMHFWFVPFVLDRLKRVTKRTPDGPVDLFICIADHFEPGYGAVSLEKQRERVDRWVKDFYALAKKHSDYDGRPPRHTWFFPPHYDTDRHLEKMVGLCLEGLGEIELHFHHNRVPPFPDTEETFRKKIMDTIESYSRFGIFPRRDNKTYFSFVHGDWGLANSRGSEFCGINNELEILYELGCYADFTFPCQYSSQPKKVNSIYYAAGDHSKAKSYEKGYDVEVDKNKEENIMMIQGILGVRPIKRIKSMCIAIEDSDISNMNPPTKNRIDYWVKNGLRIKGSLNKRFIKLHTHGAWEGCMEALLSDDADEMYNYLEEKYNDGTKYRLHYVTAREMYNVIKAAEYGIRDISLEHMNFKIDQPGYRI